MPASEFVGVVYVDGDVIALHFPVSGYLDGALGMKGAVGGGQGEIPSARKAQVVGTFREAFGQSFFAGVIPDYLCPAGLCVDRGGLDILPKGEDGQDEVKDENRHIFLCLLQIYIYFANREMEVELKFFNNKIWVFKKYSYYLRKNGAISSIET